MQRSLNLHPLFQPLFRKISQPPGQDQQKGGVCRLPPYSFRIGNPEPQRSSIPYLFTIFIPVICQTCILHHGWRKIQKYGVQITGKCVCKSKKLNLNIFTPAKFSPRFNHHPQGVGNYSFSPGSTLSKICSPSRKGSVPQQRGWQYEYIISCSWDSVLS